MMKKELLKKVMVAAATAVMLFSSVATVDAAQLISSADGTQLISTNTGDEITVDPSGNVFYAGQEVNLGQQKISNVGNELFAAGNTVNCDGAEVDGSVFAAGRIVSLNFAKAGGSVFLAGQSIEVAAEADNNMFIAGMQLNLTEDTSAKALYAAGENVNVRGNYQYVSVSAETIYFDATVDGDVVLEGENIHIGPNAKVTGTIVSKYNDTYEASDKASLTNASAEKIEKSEKKTTGQLILLSLAKRVKDAIKYLFVNTVVALFMAFFFRRNLKEAAVQCKAKPGSFLGFGALALIVSPIALLLLLFTFIGTKMAVIGYIFYGIALALQGVFTFASFGRELFFGKAKKRLHPVLEIIIAVLPYAIACQIPGIGLIVNLFCGLYTFGYIVYALGKKIQENKEDKVVTKSAPAIEENN